MFLIIQFASLYFRDLLERRESRDLLVLPDSRQVFFFFFLRLST